jgi:hypothetical protein
VGEQGSDDLTRLSGLAVLPRVLPDGGRDGAVLASLGGVSVVAVREALEEQVPGEHRRQRRQPVGQ